MRVGRNYHVADDRDIEITDVLPPELYQVNFDGMANRYFLTPQNQFIMPTKLYGTVEGNARRILNTFQIRPLTTGVHLDGLKGSGKTLLAKQICNTAIKEFKTPVLMISSPFAGDAFNKFISEIDTPSVLLFDEFEKVYPRKEQDALLTLLDGTYSSKKMFIITSNDKFMVSDFLINRPGRIFYSLEFKALEEIFVREFCKDNLTNKAEIESVVSYSQVYPNFNFDMLNAIVEEMNRYDEKLIDALKWLNITPDDSQVNVTVTVEYKGTNTVINKNYTEFNPVSFRYRLDASYLLESYDGEVTVDDESAVKQLQKMLSASRNNSRDAIIYFDTTNLTSFDKKTGTYTYTKDFRGAPLHMHMRKNTARSEYDTWLRANVY
jgi:hypothetical protein